MTWLSVLAYGITMLLLGAIAHDIWREAHRHPVWREEVPTLGGYEVLETLRRAGVRDCLRRICGTRRSEDE